MFKAFLSPLAASVCALMMGFCAFPALAQDVPDAGQLLKNVRQAATLQENKDVGGQIRKKSTKVPFSMSLRGNQISFQYQIGAEWTRFDLKFKDSKQDIVLWKGTSSSMLPPSQYGEPIAGTDVTYEDLSLRFLYWPNPKIVSDDASKVVKGRECWIVQIPNPSPKVGQYAWMRVWIDKENGAMWQIDGIDDRGELAKRFMIDSLMKLKDGSWFFKRMKVEVRDPANPRRTISVNYIDMNNLE